MTSKIKIFLSKLKTPNLVYQLHRRLFCWTNGKWNNSLTWLLQKINRPIAIQDAGILVDELRSRPNLPNQLHKDGYFVFQKKLSPDKITKIIEFSKSIPLNYAMEDPVTKKIIVRQASYEEMERLPSPRFQANNSDLFKCPELVELIFDQSLLKIAQEYLGSRPIMDSAIMWWSQPCSSPALQSYTAQKYHFDMDRIKFLKFFFYLTDVSESNGPHCFIRGTNISLPSYFRKDRRFTDDEIAKFYPPSEIVEFTAPSGTIIAEDTRGLHKGKSLTHGNRLMFEIEFANSMFGMFFDRVRLGSDPLASQVRERIQNNPLVYAPIFVESF